MDELPDWSLFQERETLQLDEELLSPAAEITAVLRASAAKFASAEQLFREAEENNFTNLAQQAVLVVQFGMLLERSTPLFESAKAEQRELASIAKSLQIIQKQMLSSLHRANLEIEIPLTKSYTEVAGRVEIERWQHSQDAVEEYVLEVIEPVIRKGPLLRPGRVVMCAPLTARPHEKQNEDELWEQEQS